MVRVTRGLLLILCFLQLVCLEGVNPYRLQEYPGYWGPVFVLRSTSRKDPPSRLLLRSPGYTGQVAPALTLLVLSLTKENLEPEYDSRLPGGFWQEKRQRQISNIQQGIPNSQVSGDGDKQKRFHAVLCDPRCASSLPLRSRSALSVVKLRFV